MPSQEHPKKNNYSQKSHNQNKNYSSQRRTKSDDNKKEKNERKPWEFEEKPKYIDQVRITSDGRAIISLQSNTPPPVAAYGKAPEASKHRKEASMATAALRNKLAAKATNIQGAGKSLRIAVGMGRFNFDKFVTEVATKAPELVSSGKARSKLMETLNNAAAASLRNENVKPSIGSLKQKIGKANAAPYFSARLFVDYFKKEFPGIENKINMYDYAVTGFPIFEESAKTNEIIHEPEIKKVNQGQVYFGLSVKQDDLEDERDF